MLSLFQHCLPPASRVRHPTTRRAPLSAWKSCPGQKSTLVPVEDAVPTEEGATAGGYPHQVAAGSLEGTWALGRLSPQ